MARRSSLRASDADRDRVAERLHQAATEGRLLAHELEERLATALRARTYGELDAVVDDLPGSPAMSGPAAALAPRTPVGMVLAHPVLAFALIATMVTAVCLAVAAVAFTGIWLIPLVFFLLARRNQRHGPHRHHGGGRPGRGPRGPRGPMAMNRW